MHRAPLHAYTPARADPLHLLRRPAVRHGRTESTSSPLRHSRSSSPHYDEPSEKTKREQSVKVNRHHKFVECLSREDVDMGSFLLSSSAQDYLTLGLFPFSFSRSISGAPETGLVRYPRRCSSASLAATSGAIRFRLACVAPASSFV